MDTPDTTGLKPVRRDGHGRFQKGSRTPNPHGRPKKDVSVVAVLRQKLDASAEGLLAVLHTKAMAGDTVAARALLDRCLPVLRSEQRAEPMPMLSGGTLSQRGVEVLEAVAAGEISPSAAAELLAGLSSLSAIKANDELEARLRAIEGRLAAEQREDL